MRASWFKWLLVFTVLLMSSGGNAHAHSDHAVAHATPCEAHEHHQGGDHQKSHQECCCTCLACPSGLVMAIEPAAPNPVAYELDLAPARAAPLASRFLSPELDPPRLSALS